MQVEKYLFHLNRWGKQGEKRLQNKFGSQLPEGLAIRIVNPGGMIIMGRDTLSDPQRDDFEIIRRKYRSIIDIITYDDLLHRLKVIRDQFGAS